MQVAQGDLKAALKSYSDSLAIFERLAQSDPGNAGWQRDLSVSYDKDRRCADGAGRSQSRAEILFRRASPLAERLAQSDPGNAGWQRDLSVSYAKLADAYSKSNERRRPAKHLRQAAPSLGSWWSNTLIRPNGSKTWLGLMPDCRAGEEFTEKEASR